jgi:hypothetical protein
MEIIARRRFQMGVLDERQMESSGSGAVVSSARYLEPCVCLCLDRTAFPGEE